MTQSRRPIFGAFNVNVGKVEKLARDWRAIVIDGAFIRYWFFSHFLFVLAIFIPAEKNVVLPWVIFLSSFGLFLVYLSSTYLLSGIAAMLGKRFLESAWLFLASMVLLVAAGSSIMGALNFQPIGQPLSTSSISDTAKTRISELPIKVEH